MKRVTSSVIPATQSCSTLLCQPGYRARQAFMTDDNGNSMVGIVDAANVNTRASAEDDWRRFELVSNLIQRRCQGSGQRAALALVAVLGGGRRRQQLLQVLGSLPANCDEGEIYAHLVDLDVEGGEVLHRELTVSFTKCLSARALRFSRRHKDTDSPEELAQEVIAAIAGDGTKPMKAVSLWRMTYRAVSYVWIHRIKRRDHEILSGLDVGTDLASSESVEQRVGHREELRRVLNVIRSLPPKERENLVRVLHRATDTGDVLQDESSGLQSRDAQKRALTRARNKLREHARATSDDAGDRHEKGQDEEPETEEEDK